jgi:uncharacterized membrane protein YbaN (DUF454 family)
MLKSHLKRYLLVALGTLALGIGMVGFVVPVLPTTPLLLISAYCYLRSSNSLYRWLIGHRVFGRYLQDYLERRTIPRRVKAVALGTLWPSLLVSMFFIPLFSMRILAALIGAAVSAYILRLPDDSANQAA